MRLGSSAEVLIDATADAVAGWLPRNLGRLEPTDDCRTRLVGTADEPFWYARHLTAIQAPYRIVSPRELRDAARDLGGLLTRAGSDPLDPAADQPAPDV